MDCSFGASGSRASADHEPERFYPILQNRIESRSPRPAAGAVSCSGVDQLTKSVDLDAIF